MTFFGLTFWGYQDPFRDRRLTLPQHEVPVGKPSPKLDLFYPKLPPIGPAGYDGTVHQGSYDKYREAVRRRQLKKNPNQEYRVPVTCAQDIGWWLPLDPSVKPEDAIPWMRTPRYPQLRSPMTKFVDRMGISNPLFTMF
nr:sperm microtubule inner protein 11 isoform X1 [Anolis sagrei ordinatus]